jgi:ferrous iron transport protein B
MPPALGWKTGPSASGETPGTSAGTAPANAAPLDAAGHDAAAHAGTGERRPRIALVGNPNVGKSVIFGALTGSYATVSNYPGTTVEVARAAARFQGGAEVVDTPGVNSLTPSSEDERVTRDILLDGVDTVVQVADAKNLNRALVVSLQLVDAGIPFVLVVNMVDEAADRGLSVDCTRLAAALGVPVVETVAISGRGVGGIGPSLDDAKPGTYRTRYPAVVERALARIEPLLAGHPVGARLLAMMCLAGDDTLRPWLTATLPASTIETIEDARADVRTQLSNNVGYQLNRARLRAAHDLAGSVTHARRHDPAAAADEPATAVAAAALGGTALLLAGDFGLAEFLNSGWARLVGWAGILGAALAIYRSAPARAALGRWASQRGIGLVVLFVVLYFVYSFVGVFAAGTAVDFVESYLLGEHVTPAGTGSIDRLVGLIGASPGLGADALQLLRDCLVGPYGLVTVALTYAIAIILPIVTAFFLVFSVLEDSGYLPRLAIVVNRTFRAMGLNGKAVLPMVLGLGCDTMATLTARIMETRKERVLVTLLLALGVPCSAQLGVILGLFGALPMWAPLVWCGVVAGVIFAVGYLAARLLPGAQSDLILEVPPIRQPQLGNIVVKTVGRLEWYLKEAVPIFLLGTFVLFVLDVTGALARIVSASEPAVVGVLNLPPKAAEAFLVGFFRRDYGSAGIYALFQDGLMTSVQAVVALVTITLFVPCVANFFVIIKERGLRTAIGMTAFIFPFAFVVGGVVNFALRAVGLQ